MPVDVSELTRLLGTDVVFTESEMLEAGAHDVWAVTAKQTLRGAYPYRPDAVVRPADESQVRTVVNWANDARVPVTPRGLGSAVTGAAVPMHGGIVLDLSRLTGIIQCNETDLTVAVRAGTRGSDLEQELQQRGYTLAHSPQSLELSSVGGWLATRATGQFSSKYGGIEDLALGFTVVLATGETVTLPSTPRAALGPDLRHLFLGGEGSFGVITRATLKIFPAPGHRVVEALRLPDVRAGVETMRQITSAGLRPFLVRCYDPAEATLALNEPDFDGCALFLGSEGVRAVAEAEHAEAARIAREHGAQSLGTGPVQRWMEHRFDYTALEQILRTPGGVAETIEVAHFWSGILDLHAELTSTLAPLASVLGHFSHVYPQGTSLYLILLGEERDAAAAEARLREIWDTAMRVCLEQGGSIAHHHGVGMARLPYVRDALGDSAILLERVKAALDPANTLNPGKLGL